MQLPAQYRSSIAAAAKKYGRSVYAAWQRA